MPAKPGNTSPPRSAKGAAASRPIRQRDPQGTRRAILSAAEKLFINRGYDGATLGEIARLAGIHQSLIHHYFGAKLDLYLEVMRLHLVNLGTRLREFMGRVDPQRDFLRDGTVAYFQFQAENPDFVRMGSWFNLFFQKNPIPVRNQSVGDPAQDEAQGYIYSLIDTLTESIVQMQKSGRIRPDIDPVLIQVVVFCLVEHWHEAKNRLLRRLPPEKQKDVTDANYLDAALKILMEGAKPR
ncbi:MAG: TetR/AcrR family transcriptional regulator [Thermodesulfobacteriota bacterium]